MFYLFLTSWSVFKNLVKSIYEIVKDAGSVPKYMMVVKLTTEVGKIVLVIILTPYHQSAKKQNQ